MFRTQNNAEEAQAYIEAIKQLANHAKVTNLCEPNVFYHREISEHDVVRILTAQRLLNEELKGVRETL